MNLMDTAQAFLDQCLMVALDSFLAEFAVNRVSRSPVSATIPPNPFWLGIIAVYNLTQVQ